MGVPPTDLDPRWPLPVVGWAYVVSLPRLGFWELRDWHGDVVLCTNNRSSCYFRAAELNLRVVQRH